MEEMSSEPSGEDMTGMRLIVRFPVQEWRDYLWERRQKARQMVERTAERNSPEARQIWQRRDAELTRELEWFDEECDDEQVTVNLHRILDRLEHEDLPLVTRGDEDDADELPNIS